MEALSEISLSLESGERLALVGVNGAGKTSLLRVMSSIYEPTSGRAAIAGRVSPMFNIGFGVDSDLSGYENIKQQGMILGLTAAQIEAQTADIADFTDLSDYLDMPVRTYSSGMMLRLNFAVATCFDPDIILMDEWVLAADSSFLGRRSIDFKASSGRQAFSFLRRTIFLKKWCTTGLWLDQGRITLAGPIDEVVSAYDSSALQEPPAGDLL